MRDERAPSSADRDHRGPSAALRLRLRSEARRRWKAWAALALAIGLAGGVSLAAAAGARRTQSAYPRLLQRVHQEDVLLGLTAGPPGSEPNDNPIDAAVAGLPEVASAAHWGQLATFLGNEPNPDSLGSVALDRVYGYRMSQPRLLEGRMPDPGRADEVLVNDVLATERGLHAGDRIPLTSVDSAALDESGYSGRPYAGPVVHDTVTVTGVGRFALDVVPTTAFEGNPRIYLTPAFFRTHAESLQNLVLTVTLRPGVTLDQFRAAVGRIVTSFDLSLHDTLFAPQAARTAKAQRAVHPQALALWLLAIVTALAAFIVLGNVLARQIFVDSTDTPLLGVLGMTRVQRFRLALVRVALVAIGGAVIAIVVASALSPLFPIGPARDAEPSPGLSVDAAAMLIGVALVIALTMARGALPAWRYARSRLDALGRPEELATQHPSRVGNALSRAGLGAAPVIGVRMALEPGRGRTSVPTRSALFTAAVAFAAVGAVVVFATSLDRLIASPARYGWDWTASVGFGFDAAPAEATQRLLDNDHLAAVAGAQYFDAAVDGTSVTGVAIDPLKGDLFPTLLSGRVPRGDHEIVLGGKTLQDIGKSVGATVEVGSPGETVKMHVVGQAVFPRLGSGAFTPTDLGEGAAMANAAAVRVGAREASPDAPDAKYSVYFVRGAPGVELATVSKDLNHDFTGIFAECPGAYCANGPQRPGDIVAYSRARSPGRVLIAILLAMFAGALIHALVTSMRRRRRDIAVLKTLGFAGRQVYSTAAWQAVTLAGIATAIGIPVGIALGRASWTLFADYLGVANDPTIPVATLALLAVATVLGAVGVALVPARIARNVKPAQVFRTT